jgi:hypothetical protein
MRGQAERHEGGGRRYRGREPQAQAQALAGSGAEEPGDEPRGGQLPRLVCCHVGF